MFIQCRDLTLYYGAQPVLNEVSFGLLQGEWAYLAGPSGSGKTTLLRALSGLELLREGTIHIGGQLASNHRLVLEPHQRAIGLLFQEPSLWPQLSAWENVALALSALPRVTRRSEAHHWLGRLGIEHLAAQPPGRLSGGEARRVALARALASRPRFLLLDEPTAHLDLHLRDQMIELLRRLHIELALTTLCVTHQLESPIESSERLLVLEEGRLLHDGPLAALQQAPQTPYLNALRRSLEGHLR